MTKNLWLARTAVFVSLLIAPACWALDLAELFGSGGDNGSGKVARLQFQLTESFVPTSIAWSPNGRYLAVSSSQSRSIHVWDVDQKKVIREIALPFPPNGAFHNLAWSPDGHFLATCNSFQVQLRIYKTDDWTVVKDFGVSEAAGCQKAIFSSDGQELTVWAADLITVSVNDWRVLRRLKSDPYFTDSPVKPKIRVDWSALIRDIAYIPGTHSLMLAGAKQGMAEGCPVPKASQQGGSGRVWIIEPGDSILTRSFQVACDAGATLVSADPTGQNISATTQAYEHATKAVQLFRAKTGELIGSPLDGQNEGLPEALAYTTDGRYLHVGHSSGDKPGPIAIIDVTAMRVADVVHSSGYTGSPTSPWTQPSPSLLPQLASKYRCGSS
jgi:WD40 repeat protein